MKKWRIFFGILCLTLIYHPLCACAQNAWIDVSGAELIQSDGAPFTIRSMYLGTEDTAAARTLPLSNVYGDISYLGFNTVTLAIRYDLLESDLSPYAYLEEGFQCLDLHIEKAAERGLYTVLHIDTPQGGYQSRGDGAGNALWLEPENQTRLMMMWCAIATRYANNPNVIGYSLLNEPCPVASDMESAIASWEKLAKLLIQIIRLYDTKHIIFVECCRGYNNLETGQNPSLNDEEMEALNCGFPAIDDARVVYQFQQYTPLSFTNQSPSNAWDTPYLVYPSEFIAALKGGTTGIVNTADNDTFPIHTPYWTTLYSEMYRVDDPEIRYVAPAVSLWDMGGYGAVWIDELYLDEYNENGDYVRTALYLSFDSAIEFSRYAETGNVRYVSTGGANGWGGTLYISGVLGGGYAVLEPACVPVRQGYSYQLHFSIGGTGLKYTSTIGPMLSFHKGGEPLTMGANYLAYALAPYLAFRERVNKPLYVGGFGANIASFNHGGLYWVRDMIALYESVHMNYNYFLYRNDYFGLYKVDGTLNEPLYQFFVNTLGK